VCACVCVCVCVCVSKGKVGTIQTEGALATEIKLIPYNEQHL
jgi:hypothetical protein